MMKRPNLSTQSGRAALCWIACLSLTCVLISTAAIAAKSATSNDDSFRHIKISGISLATPLDQVAGILTAQGYTEINSRLFTKQGELQNNRRTIFRIEIEDTVDLHRITYHRSLSGGRVKTAGGDEPIPEYEVDTAQRFYRLMCENILKDETEERQCEPSTVYSITAGNGRFIRINDHYSMQLDVTAANSTIGIQYSQ
jgi:hypothetical protein